MATRSQRPAKVSAPRRTEVYQRVRLFRALDVALQKRAVWITAPAGAGKTSLITSYLAARKARSLWYNIDARDADVANLFHYLATAARSTSPRKKWALPVFGAEAQTGAVAFASGFFEILYQKLPVPTIIVFDDYQEVQSEACDEIVKRAIEVLPEGISVVVASRAEPPPLLIRHVASGDIAVLRADELRLTSTEVAGLIRLYRPELRNSEVAVVRPRIRELAEGWAAVVRLLLLNPHFGIDDAARDPSPELVFDYFAAEIFDKLGPRQRDFLCKTSIVPSVTSELAAELTGENEAARVLADLERQSFLTQRLGTLGAFRYHPLWRDFLVRRAERDLGHDTLCDLRRCAAKSLVRAGLIDEAMDQFEAARDLDEAARLLFDVAPSYLAQGKGQTLARWIDRLPPGHVEANGWLSYWSAMCRLGYAPEIARKRFERAFTLFTEAGDAAGLYAACAGAIQAIAHEATSFARFDKWVERFEALQKEGVTCPDAVFPAAVASMLITSVYRRPNFVQHRKWAEHAMALALAADDVGFRVMTGGFLALYYYDVEPDRARAIVEMLREVARADAAPALAALTLLLGETIAAWTEGDNQKCITYAREALAIASRSGVFVWNEFFYSMGAEAALTVEDLDGAREFLEALRQGAGRGMFATGCYHSYASWDALLRGDMTCALKHIEPCLNATDALGYPFARAVARLASAQVLFTCGRKRDAVASLEESRQIATQGDEAIVIFGCDLVEADITWDDDRPRALAALRRGLAYGRKKGIYNTYWSRMSMMVRLAVFALENDIEPGYVRTLIARRRLRPGAIAVRVEGWPWRFRVRALGSFEVVQEAHEHSTSSPPLHGEGLRGMPLRLLQAIIAFGARGVRETQIVDALWPDAEGDAGRRVFDTTLHRLRRQLGGDDLVQLRDGRVYINEHLCWLDVWALDHLLVHLDQQLDQEAPVAVLTESAKRLLELYRGPLLEDVADDGWIRGPRQRLEGRFRRAAERLSAALHAAGQLMDAAALRKWGALRERATISYAVATSE